MPVSILHRLRRRHVRRAHREPLVHATSVSFDRDAGPWNGVPRDLATCERGWATLEMESAENLDRHVCFLEHEILNFEGVPGRPLRRGMDTTASYDAFQQTCWPCVGTQSVMMSDLVCSPMEQQFEKETDLRKFVNELWIKKCMARTRQRAELLLRYQISRTSLMLPWANELQLFRNGTDLGGCRHVPR